MLLNNANQTPPGYVAIEWCDVTAACIAVLTREIRGLGLDSGPALRLLNDAPAKIEAALAMGPNGLVMFCLDASAPAAIASDDDDHLARFEADAQAAGVSLLGLNPTLVAALAARAEGFAGMKHGGGQYERALH